MLPSLLHSQRLLHQSPSSTLLNLSVSPLCTLLLPPSLSLPRHSSLLVLICLLWPISFCVVASAASQLSQQASLLFTLALLLPFIRLTNKVESKHSHRHAHECATTQARRRAECGFRDLDAFHGSSLPSAGQKSYKNVAKKACDRLTSHQIHWAPTIFLFSSFKVAKVIIFHAVRCIMYWVVFQGLRPIPLFRR